MTNTINHLTASDIENIRRSFPLGAEILTGEKSVGSLSKYDVQSAVLGAGYYKSTLAREAICRLVADHYASLGAKIVIHASPNEAIAPERREVVGLYTYPSITKRITPYLPVERVEMSEKMFSRKNLRK